MGSIFGEIFKVAAFGESHGPALGCVIDGCPAGLALGPHDFVKDMERRRPGHSPYASKRREADEVELLSGVFDSFTTGTPIALLIRNQGQRPEDYKNLAGIFRPGHADFSYAAKYGMWDERGGGRASGRETAARVAAGVVAKKILAELGITIAARTSAIGGIEVEGEDFTSNPQILALLEECLKSGDSVGSMISCGIYGVKAGVGGPVFGKLSAALAGAVHSIGGVKGVEFGAGFAAAAMKGTENNDGFTQKDDKIAKTGNKAGGILGGISDGDEIYFKVAIKPPPSVRVAQHTVNTGGGAEKIVIEGRHDPVIAPRACVVVEAMAALVLVDQIFCGFTDRMENVRQAYCK